MRLYTKFMVWSVLNLVMIGVIVFGGTWLLLGTNGLVAHFLFRGGINSVMQIVAANIQYKPLYDWPRILESYSKSYGIRFHAQALDAQGRVPGPEAIPAKILAVAQKIPRPQVSFCQEPVDGDTASKDAALEMESGFLPLQNALYLRAGTPPQYWYGRPVFIPDENHHLHYVLLVASSASFFGNGLYFNFYGALITIGAVLGLSFCWWLPFVLHITRPVTAITENAERIAAGNYTLPETGRPARGSCRPRRDEIGRLTEAVASMSSQLMRQMFGQRRFIRHIAHELGSPLARAKFGLAVLESRLDGENEERVRTISKDMERVAELVEDVLGYLRTEGLPGQPHVETFPLADPLEEIIHVEGQNAQVELRVPKTDVCARTDLECLRRAVGNALRNAVRYAGAAGPIVVAVETKGNEAVVRVEDCGPGVAPEEMEHLTEPFFRGASSSAYPGGSGLGLSIVKHCMELCGGQLTFANRQPQGFCVAMSFPLDRDKPQAG